LPELPEIAANAAAVSIECGPVDTTAIRRWSVLWRGADGNTWAEAARLLDTYVVRIIDFAVFQITAESVRIDARPGVRESTIRHLLLDQVLPLAFAAQGALVLHASAVYRSTAGLIALAGAAGAGKTTLAAALRRDGWKVASDDGVLIEAGEQIVAVPAYAGLRVWPDSLAAAGLDDLAVCDVAEYSAKLRVAPLVDHDGSSRPLRSIFVLQPGDKLRVTPLGRRDAAVAILQHAYRADLSDRPALVSQLDVCAYVAERVRVFRATIPRDLSRLRDVARSISAHATVE
jgi:hypothetical protein